MADPSIFRPSALERLSSPERLDELMQVTSPRGWLALIALGLIVSTVTVWGLVGEVSSRITAQGILLRGAGPIAATASISGTVSALRARPGQRVSAGSPIAEIQTGASSRHLVASPLEGRLLELRVRPGQLVDPGTTVATLEPAEGPLHATVYVSPLEGKSVRPGMTVELLPSHARAEESGYLLGVVRGVSVFPATQESMLAALGARELVDRFSSGGPPYQVDVELAAHPSIAGAYRWSSPRPPPAVESGTFCVARIIVRTQRPIDLVIPRRDDRTF